MKVKIKEQLSVVGSKNLTVGSEHETVPCPKEHQRYKHDIWVQGEKEPVRLFQREYEITDTSEPNHPAFKIDVQVINVSAISDKINKQLKEIEKYKEHDYELKDTLAIVKCKNNEFILTDKEACFFDEIAKNPVQIDVYRKSVEKTSENGNKSTSVFMFPTCQIEFSYEDFKEFIIKETNLAEFMGDRFQYNPRLQSNLTFLMEHINK